MKIDKRNSLGWLVSGVAAAALMVCSHAVRAEEQKSFAIGAQSVSSALIEFAAQSKVRVMASGDAIAAANTRGISGDLTTEEALDQLLAGTGLTYHRMDDGAIVVKKIGDNAKNGAGADFRQFAQASNNGVNAGNGSAEGENTFVLEEIIVTATRREERLLDVAGTVSAYSTDRLEASGVNNVEDLQFLAAGMQITPVIGQTIITLRGIGSNSFSFGAESGVAVHRDGVYLSQRRDIGTGFFDVERIEVLRGPQGTLYGRNATGGAVNIISRKPTDSFEGRAKATIGNYGLVETEAAVSGPIYGDTVLGRIAFLSRKDDGYTENIHNGEHYNNSDVAAVRGILTFKPSDVFSANFTADYVHDDGIRVDTVFRGRTGNPLPHETDGEPLPGGRDANFDGENHDYKRLWGYLLDMSWDIGFAELKSLTSLRQAKVDYAGDLDRGTRATLDFVSDTDSKQWSQELILSSLSDGPLQWILGGTYFNKSTDYGSVAFLPGLSLEAYTDIPDSTEKAIGIFGEATYNLTDQLELTAGARYSKEDKSYSSTATTLIGGVQTAQTLTPFDESWSNFSPKVALSYSWSDTLTSYIVVSKGFKSGGFNTIGTTFDQEVVLNYEAGIKGIFADRRVQTNLSLFRMDYDDLQVLVQGIHPVTGGAVNVTDNAATSTVQGAEFEFTAQFTNQFGIDGNIAYLDATYDKWEDAIDIGGTGAPTDVSGNRLLNAPELAFNVGATFDFDMGDWATASLRGEYAYKSRTYFSTPFELGFFSQKGAGLLNFRMEVQPVDSGWSFAAFMKNVTDEVIVVGMNEGSALTGNGQYRALYAPRTYGLTVGYRF